MRVRAKRVGYIHHKLMEEGEEFDLVDFKAIDPETEKEVTITAEQQFSRKWMVKVQVKDESAAVVADAALKPKAEEKPKASGIPRQPSGNRDVIS